MAPRGARAAGRADAAHRSAPESSRGRFGISQPHRSFARTWPNWLRLRRMSSWRLAVRSWERCNKRPALCRSCLWRSSIRSAPDSSRASPGQPATRPALPGSNTASARNGWSFSSRLIPIPPTRRHRALSGDAGCGPIIGRGIESARRERRTRDRARHPLARMHT